MCGENPKRNRVKTPRPGSPPRVRGKHSVNFEALDASGITPACAGKTSSAPSLSPRARDHPRVCGENDHDERQIWTCEGSPPRVRGKPEFILCLFSFSGITPACAGKTEGNSRQRPMNWDHPRVCGENEVFLKENRCQAGSPPRVRGKRIRRNVCAERFGITPACAGKTAPLSVRFFYSWDHPRVCGENTSEMAYFRG